MIFITAFASSVSQIMLNLSNTKKYNNRINEYLNQYVLGAYTILGIVLMTNAYILQFVPLKVGHALAASTYLFTMILSGIFLKEKITKKKIIGNGIILIGIWVFVL